MAIPSWQIQTPLDAIIFDCDGTLSTIEGIDELASNNGVGKMVKALTEEAMGKTGMNPELYEKRLELVKPNFQQVEEIGDQYFIHRVPDIEAIIALFKRFNKSVFLVSAGLYPSVALFGERLGIPKSHIFAVDIRFDDQQRYLNFDQTSPLTRASGKREIVLELKKKYPALSYVGDGLNDLPVYDLVNRFIGYGGAYYRKNIADRCEFYINTSSMAPLLALTLTMGEINQLTEKEAMLYQKGAKAITLNEVKVP